MKIFRHILPVVMVFVAASIAGEESSPNDVKKEKTLKVMKISGAAQAYVEALLEGVRQSPIPAEDKDLYCKFATVETLMEYFVPVYMENYTDEELDAMLAFYSTPVGQAIVRKSLPVVRELRKSSIQWGMVVSARVNTEKARLAAEKDK